jgi:hypothetical protein
MSWDCRAPNWRFWRKPVSSRSRLSAGFSGGRTMRVKAGERICFEGSAVAEATEDLLFHDYYSQTPRIRLTGEAEPEPATEIMLDHNDVARLVACAIRHPSLNMRQSALTAIWHHPDAFREILRFGLHAPEAFSDIRKVVADELAKNRAADATPVQQADKTLLPKLPLPAHLRDRGKQ